MFLAQKCGKQKSKCKLENMSFSQISQTVWPNLLGGVFLSGSNNVLGADDGIVAYLPFGMRSEDIKLYPENKRLK